MSQAGPVFEALKTTDPNEVANNISILINNEPMDKYYNNMYVVTGVEFARDNSPIVKNLEDDLDKIYQQEMEAYYNNVGLSRLTEVNTTTVDVMQKQLRSLIKTMESEGLGVEEIARTISKRFEKEYGATSRWRAKRIAQTEVLTASNKGTLVSVESLGVPYKKQWLTGGRSKTERHTLLPSWSETNNTGLHGQMVDQGKDFVFSNVNGKIVTGQYPGVTDSSEDNINCKCVVVTKII
jgi:hypothetical protein